MAKAVKPPKGSFKDKFAPFSKAKQRQAKALLGMKKPKIDMTAQEEMAERQRLEQADLDTEENRRRKQFLSAAQGIRAYRGSPMFRASPGNSSGRAATAGAAVSGAVAAGRGVTGGGSGRGDVSVR